MAYDTTQSPYQSVVRVSGTFGGRSFYGSGVLIAPNEVLTASHLVYESDLGFASNLTVTPGYNLGAEPFGRVSVTATHFNDVHISGGFLSLYNSQFDVAVLHLERPLELGTFGYGASFSGGTVDVTGYPSSGLGAQVDVQETAKLDTAYTYLIDAPALSPGSSGGPMWITDSTGRPNVVGVVSSGGIAGEGYFARVAGPNLDSINGWVAQDAALDRANANYAWASAGTTGTAALDGVGVGGPSYINYQKIWATNESVAINCGAPNVFLHSGTGNDALQVSVGHNVLDGGTGSNFLTGTVLGKGVDTFFTDARGSAVVWNTIRNFHAGDAATLWGFTQGVSSWFWDKAATGAAGYEGATLRANIVGGAGRTGNGIDASITFTGLSLDQAQRLQVSTGSVGAGSYLYLSNPGV